MASSANPDAAYNPNNEKGMRDADNDAAYLTKGRGGQGGGPQVVRDEEAASEGLGNVPSRVMDSDQQLERDEKEAIDEGNIMGSKKAGIQTRHATKPKGTYREPGDEEGLPGPDDGSSAVRTAGLDTEGTL